MVIIVIIVIIITIYLLSFRYIFVDVHGNTRFLPVHSHCVANDCILPTLLVKILYVLDMSMLLISFQF
jgi:hypothetical protein